jgi:Domain of unknown function (DUF4112)
LVGRPVSHPGTRRRLGVDGLLGLVPGIGDTATALIASYIVLEAWRLGAPKGTIARMLANLGIDYVIGLVPLAGGLGRSRLEGESAQRSPPARPLGDAPARGISAGNRRGPQQGRAGALTTAAGRHQAAAFRR